MAESENNPSLPMEILLHEILHRLPTKSIIRFKCLNKEFYNYISSPKFVDLHLQRALSTNANRLLFKDKNNQWLYSIDLNSNSNSNSTAINIPVPPTLYKGEHKHKYESKGDKPESIYVVGTYNGLVCLGFPWSTFSKWGERFMFLNPLTGTYRTEVCYEKLGSRRGLSTTSFGFGYDRVKDDYKIVEVTNYFWNYPDIGGQGGREVVVYSVNTGSWNCVEAASYQDSYQPRPMSGVLIHSNLLHWLFWYLSEGEFRIGCFDLETERWTAYYSPPKNYFVVDEHTLPGTIDGCLCYSINLLRIKCTHVWIMKKYGVEKSWMKLFIITPRLSLTSHPFVYWRRKKREVLLNLDHPQLEGEGCFWYYFGDEPTKRLTFNGAPPSFKLLTSCLETLVPLHNGCQIKNEKIQVYNRAKRTKFST